MRLTSYSPFDSSSCSGSSPLAWGRRLAMAAQLFLLPGSSPLAWGRRPDGPGVRRRHRFIPTRVGSTPLQPFSCNTFPVHPHSRGVDADWLLGLRYIFGSSPLAWGRLIAFTYSFCGRYGSSPLAWGRPGDLRRRHRAARFIPTRVGSTSLDQREAEGVFRFIPTRVGSTVFGCPVTSRPFGSSPLAWGRLCAFLSLASRYSGSSPLAWGRRQRRY